MDIKGILSFIGVTFGITYLGEAVLLHLGLIVFDDPKMLHNIIFLLLLWIPALGAVIANKISPTASENQSVFWPIPFSKGLAVTLLIPIAFILFNVLAALGGWTEVQFRMGTMMNQVNEMMRQPLSEELLKVAPMVFLIGGPILTVLLGATVFAAVMLGGELGWRGYLLPRLLPLGRIPAYLISGALWGLWFLPLIIGACQANGKIYEAIPMTFCFIGVGVSFGAVLSELWRRTKNLGLTALGVGAFAANVQGIWSFLFPIQKAPFTGPFGLMSIIVWCAAFLVLILFLREKKVDASVS